MAKDCTDFFEIPEWREISEEELEPFPDPYKSPPPFKMDIRGLFEYAQKTGREIKDLPYVEVLDFIG